MRERDELPQWLWLWLPPLMLVVILVARVMVTEVDRVWFNRKEGPIEWATFLVLLPAVVAGLSALRHRRYLPTRWLVRWLAVVTCGTVYFALEEVSWGQSLFHWETPAGWLSVNQQSETNLHNVTSWLNEKPRLLLELFVLFGGLIVPIVYRPRWPQPAPAAAWRPWFWPTRVTIPVAALAIGIYLPDQAEKLFVGFSVHRATGLRLSEPQEYYFAYFLLIYLLSLNARLRIVAGTHVDVRPPA